MSRFFISPAKAAYLILEALAFSSGGETFIVRPRKSTRIADLAKYLIWRQSNNKTLEISYSGLRSGERIFDTIDEEQIIPTHSEELYILRTESRRIEDVREIFESLTDAVQKGDIRRISIVTRESIPTFSNGNPAFSTIESE